MIALFKKYWFVPTGILAGALLWLTVGQAWLRPTPPPPSVVQTAAQHAAGAIVTTQMLDTVLAQHKVAAIELAQTQARVTRLKVVAAHRLVARAAIPIDSAAALVKADTEVIAAYDSLARAQDSVVQRIVQDDSALVQAARVARDTIKPYETPVIPATPVVTSPLSRITAGLGHTVKSLLVPTVGYGAVYDGHTFTPGPAAAIGLHLTSGAIGITGGVGVVYHNGFHAGVSLTLGVRL